MLSCSKLKGSLVLSMKKVLWSRPREQLNKPYIFAVHLQVCKFRICKALWNWNRPPGRNQNGTLPRAVHFQRFCATAVTKWPSFAELFARRLEIHFVIRKSLFQVSTRKLFFSLLSDQHKLNSILSLSSPFVSSREWQI